MSYSQQAANQILLYIEGHVAASRKAWQLCSGSMLLCLKEQSCAPNQWFDDFFSPASWNKSTAEFFINDKTTHFQCELDELVDSCMWLLKHAQDLQRVVDRCLSVAATVFSTDSQRSAIEAAVRLVLQDA
jgi:hypothetical protein